MLQYKTEPNTTRKTNKNQLQHCWTSQQDILLMNKYEGVFVEFLNRSY